MQDIDDRAWLFRSYRARDELALDKSGMNCDFIIERL
jgi:hypothetical protein